MKSYAVIGLGRFGTKIATSLYENGEDVLALDRTEDLVDRIGDRVTRAACVDAKDKDELRRLGVADCDCAIVALGSDLASSVLITMNLKTLGVKNIICKAHDETHREILEKLGADRVIIPEHEEAEKLARQLSSPNIFEFIELSDEYSISEISPAKSWIGRTMQELALRAKYRVNVIAMRTRDRILISIPEDFLITADCKLVLLGEYSALDQIQEIR